MAKTITDTHWDDCPKCGPPHKVAYYGQDTRKRTVYQCQNCGHKFGVSTMKVEHGKRMMQD